jgi:hypothetical protein
MVVLANRLADQRPYNAFRDALDAVGGRVLGCADLMNGAALRKQPSPWRRA